jgi:hypothetical protein
VLFHCRIIADDGRLFEKPVRNPAAMICHKRPPVRPN